MICVRFFARVREALDTEELALSEADVADLDALQDHLQQLGEPWRSVLAEPNLLRAVNHEVVHGNRALADGDEVAFYPPVTGG
ncbi:molybdopterin synthase sulfur carrier subunit [Parahaliea maris]|uniref:Molybdopterin synthase sulfur carrier subunit n=1 Tax=Parahaliea maris TaxID=2716870 RepID=A0A5C9A436_9GAMM|nr:MoaD/ThiS family protein [Parahaliea maris]TXS95645.1 molybdopterin synthase sulfur carrier subunit [Parahaliea maris]